MNPTLPQELQGITFSIVQVVFAVGNLARSLDFYQRAFGWPRNERVDYDNYVELLPPNGGALGLFERDGFARLVGADPSTPPEEAVAPSYLYVRVEDVRKAAAQLGRVGARPLSPLGARSWGEDAAWFADPDGNVIAVAQLQSEANEAELSEGD